jgi:hypothetical protein
MDACTSQPSTIAVPSPAYDIHEHHLSHGVGNQVDFKLRAAYPDVSVLTFYRRSYATEYWTLCRNDGGWDQVVQRTHDGSYIPVRQKFEYLYSEKKNELLLIALRYYGDSMQSALELPNWNDRTQHVTVDLYRLNSGDDKHLQALGCKQSK